MLSHPGLLADALALPDTTVYIPTQRPWHVLPVQRRVLLFFNLNPICYYLFGWDYEHSDALLTEADMSASAAEQARASRALQHYSQSYMCWGVRGIPP